MHLARSPRRRGGSPRRRAGPRIRISPSSAIATSVPGSGRPTVPKRTRARRVERRGGARLGHAVALEHEHAAGVEELEDLAADRRGAVSASRRRSPNTAAHLGEHEPVGERGGAGAAERARAARPRAPARAPAPPSRSAQSKSARLSAALLRDAVEDGRVDLLEDRAGPTGSASGGPRPARRRSACGSPRQKASVPPASSVDALRRRGPASAPAAGTGRSPCGCPAARARGTYIADGGQQVGVGEHAALRRPGRARRVDDRGDVAAGRTCARRSATTASPVAAPARAQRRQRHRARRRRRRTRSRARAPGSARAPARPWRPAPRPRRRSRGRRSARGRTRTPRASWSGRSGRRSRRRTARRGRPASTRGACRRGSRRGRRARCRARRARRRSRGPRARARRRRSASRPGAVRASPSRHSAAARAMPATVPAPVGWRDHGGRMGSVSMVMTHLPARSAGWGAAQSATSCAGRAAATAAGSSTGRTMSASRDDRDREPDAELAHVDAGR